MDNYDEQDGKLLRKIKENPFMPVGIVGMLCACAYGAYGYKKRGKMSTSVYLMQLRVGAQSMVVGTLALGVLYKLIDENILKKRTS